MYYKDKSKIIKAAFSYIVGKSYFPAGKEGEEFKIIKLESKLIPRPGSFSDNVHLRNADPKDEKYKSGEHWVVEVIIEGKPNDKRSVTMEKVLKQLKIKPDFDTLLQ